MAGFGKKDLDMTQGTIWKLILRFAFPLIVGLMFQQLYNTVDTIIVGQYVGKAALAAVGSTASIINMMVGLCSGMATGAGVVISQSYGAKDKERLQDAVHTTMALTLISCVIVTVVGLLITDPMLRAMKTPDDVLNDARNYLLVFFSGISGMLLYNMGAGILRAVGDSSRPLYFLIISALLNVAGDLIFVLAFRMGVVGVAIATVLAQMISAILVLYVLSHTKADYAFHWKELRIKKQTVLQILNIGLPSGVQQALTSFSNVFVQSAINAFGSAAMAAWSAYNKLDMFIFLPMQSISMASTTFVGQNVGAGDYVRTRKGVYTCLSMCTGITAFLSVMMLFFGKYVLAIFSSDPEVIEFGIKFLVRVAPFYVCCGFNQIFAGALRGTGNAKIPMIIMLSSFVFFRQFYLFVVRLVGSPFNLVAFAYPVGWIMCSLLMTIAFRRSAIYKVGKES